MRAVWVPVRQNSVPPHLPQIIHPAVTIPAAGRFYAAHESGLQEAPDVGLANVRLRPFADIRASPSTSRDHASFRGGGALERTAMPARTLCARLHRHDISRPSVPDSPFFPTQARHAGIAHEHWANSFARLQVGNRLLGLDTSLQCSWVLTARAAPRFTSPNFSV
jgi:hypothetical protein